MAKKRRRAVGRPRVLTRENTWQSLYESISDGSLIPIISNAVRLDSLFDVGYDGTYGRPAEDPPPNADLAELFEGNLPINHQLAETWAHELGYPLRDRCQMARVADVDRRVYNPDTGRAKRNYLAFLKRALLWWAEDDESAVERVNGLKPQALQNTSIGEMDNAQIQELDLYLAGSALSEIALALGYPKFDETYRDPLQVLAELPLPLYLTTCRHDFLERALKDAGRTRVRTQVCHWFSDPVPAGADGPVSYGTLAVEHVPWSELDLNDPEQPVVYHLFGLDAYPSSLVVTEDDYLDFLAKVIREDSDQTGTVLPHTVRSALIHSSVLLLGYRLQDWEFKVLFRGLLRDSANRDKTRIVIQLDPYKQACIQGPDNPEPIHQYLRKYFEPNYRVNWGTTEMFLDRLEQEWNSRRSEQP